MNADLLSPSSKVFYLRGTTGERVPATVVGLSLFLDCAAISYERSGHTQLYKDCPLEQLTLWIVFLFGIFNNEGEKPLENKALGTTNCSGNQAF